MNKLQYAMGVSKKHVFRYKHLKHHKGTGIVKMLTNEEMKANTGMGTQPRHALKFKM